MGSCHGGDESNVKKAEGGLDKEKSHETHGASCCGGSAGNWLSFAVLVLLLVIALKLFKVL